MIWDEADSVAKLQELVMYEATIYSNEDLSSVEDYLKWITENGLRICLFRDMNKQIIGTYQTFKNDGKVYMAGFSVAKAHRGTHVAETVMRKLIRLHGDEEIVCKVRPDNIPMRRFLIRNGWENKLDKFEAGELWMWWTFTRGNKVLKQKIK